MPRDHTVKDLTAGSFFLTGIFWFKLYRLLFEFKNTCDTGYTGCFRRDSKYFM